MSNTQPVLKSRPDSWIMLALFVAALVVRLMLAQQLTFPQLDDPAGYIQLAHHLAAGRGFVSDVLWNYWVPFNSVTHPSNEFWMPLASVLMAGSIRLFGDTLLAAYLPGILAGSLLPPVTYWMGRTLWPRARRWSVLAALLLVSNAVLVYQSVSADSSALYTLLATLTLFTAAPALDRRRVLWAALSGVLCGLSYLTRSHGILLPIVIGLVGLVALCREPRTLIKFGAVIAIGFFALVIPWWLRNYSVFGATQPIPFTTIIASRGYEDWFNYTDQPTISSMLAMGWPAIIQLRLDALLKALGVILTMTFPFGVIGLPVAIFRREKLFRLLIGYGAALYLGVSLILPSAAVTGSFYHSAGPFVVLAALGSSVVVKALFDRPARRVSVALYAIIIGLCIGQSALAGMNAIATSRAEGQQFAAIADWVKQNLPPDQPIITNEAHSLNYASGYPALTLPNHQDVVTLRQLADRYGARYVVVVGSIGLYPDALDQPGAHARRVAELPGSSVYELMW